MSGIERLEALLDDPVLATAIAALEVALPIGVRPRQLRVQTLLLGAACCLIDGRPAHLSRVHEALVSLGEADKRRLGVLVEDRGVAHLLTYRQVEYLNHLIATVLAKSEPDGRRRGASKISSTRCSTPRCRTLTRRPPPRSRSTGPITRASPTPRAKTASPPIRKPPGDTGEEAGRARRASSSSAPTSTSRRWSEKSTGPRSPELVRQMTLSACDNDPVPVAVTALVGRFAPRALLPGAVLADSGYAHRAPEHFALALRAAGASLVMDLHPADRGPQGTFAGAVLANGSLYSPKTPTALFDLGPLARGGTDAEVRAHDDKSAELARYKLGRMSADDADGYHRVSCPAVAGRLRCPLRPASMTPSYAHPTVIAPPEHPPVCCTQKSVNVPASVNAKTRPRHDYPGKAWRASYARRSAVERSNSRITGLAVACPNASAGRGGLVTPKCEDGGRSKREDLAVRSSRLGLTWSYAA